MYNKNDVSDNYLLYSIILFTIEHVNSCKKC